jgi:hypothetical protein
MNGMSNNATAQLLDIAEGTVRNRITEMSQQSVLFEKENSPKEITEDIAYDGFETFTFSQFSPCYVNTVVGSHSMFLYLNTFSPLNRKGRMTFEQKIKNSELIEKHGLYPQNAVYSESLYIFKILSDLAPGRTIFMDEHKSYDRAWRSFNSTMNIETINSKVRRDPSNPLFPINRLHNMYRHTFSSQQRETISFQKHEAALMEKMQLYKVYQNFMKTKFVKKNKYDSHAHEWSPAMYLGLAKKVLNFEEVFGVRKSKTQFRLDEKENNFMSRKYPYSRQKIVA